MKNNIILIGMPSCGKSVTGVLLAKILNKQYIDVDLMIQARAGKGLQAIINEDGVEAFKKLEEKVMLSIDAQNAVIATGGSGVYYEAAMEHLKRNGVAVYINVPIEDLKKRLRNIKTRGVAMGKGQTIDDLYSIRRPLYEKYADITVVSGNHNSLEDTVEKILEKILSQ